MIVILYSNQPSCSFEQLFEAADVIQKLQLVAQELPSSKFGTAQKRIGQKYDEIERCLIEEFVRAQTAGDRAQMKHIAAIISQFKGYSQCIDAFIEQSQTVQTFQRRRVTYSVVQNTFLVGCFRER